MTSILKGQRQPDSKEDPVTKRHLKFLIYMLDLAKKDPDWNCHLKEMVESFGEISQ